MKKQLKIGLIVFILLFSAIPAEAATLNLVDSSGNLLQEIPVVKQGEDFLVDLYEFFHALDYKVNWRVGVNRLEVRDQNNEFNFTPWNRRILSDQQRLFIARHPVLNKGRIYLAARSTANFLNSQTSRSVIWNPSRTQMQLVEAKSDHQQKKDPIGSFLQEKSRTKSDRWVVVIDPGHGGRDPGAIGANGLQEKKVVLEISRILKKYFQNNYENIKPVLTRDADSFLPLKDRTRMANELNADIFLSLHANSGYTEYATGFEAFTLSSEPSDPSAKELAEIENSALRYEGHDAEDLDDISWILWKLRATVHTRQSQKLARKIIGELNQELSTTNRGVKQAPFWVLKDAQMPAVLVESGFLSNPGEEQKLRSTKYQRSVARSLAQAIHSYCKKHF